MTIETQHCTLVYLVNTAPFQVRRALRLRPPSLCEYTGRRCGAPRRRKGSRARRPLSEDSQEPRNREPPWSRGQACHQYPHEDGRGPSGGARCHITRRHITTHLYTRIRHFYLSLYRTKHGTIPSFITKVTSRLRVDSVATRAILIRASRRMRTLDVCWAAIMIRTIMLPSWVRRGPKPDGNGRVPAPEDHTHVEPISLTQLRGRGKLRGKIKALNEAATNATGSQRIHTIITDIGDEVWCSAGNEDTAAEFNENSKWLSGFANCKQRNFWRVLLLINWKGEREESQRYFKVMITRTQKSYYIPPHNYHKETFAS